MKNVLLVDLFVAAASGGTTVASASPTTSQGALRIAVGWASESVWIPLHWRRCLLSAPMLRPSLAEQSFVMKCAQLRGLTNILDKLFSCQS